MKDQIIILHKNTGISYRKNTNSMHEIISISHNTQPPELHAKEVKITRK